MKLQMQSIHFTADQKLLDYVQKKADKLETYYDKIIDGIVYFKVDKGEKVDNKIIEFKINVPGTTLFVQENSRTFEAAFDMAIDAMSAQVKKYKDKQLQSARV